MNSDSVDNNNNNSAYLTVYVQFKFNNNWFMILHEPENIDKIKPCLKLYVL
jgi:hypothetical protein